MPALPLVTLADACEHLNQSLPQPGDRRAKELERFIAAASDIAEEWTRRVIAPREITETHEIPRRGSTVTRLQQPVVWLRYRPVLDLLAVETDGQPALIGPGLGAQVLDAATGQIGVAATGSRVSIRFRAGMNPVPARYETGVLQIVRHLWRSQEAAASDRYGRDDVDTVEVAGWSVPRAAVEMFGRKGMT